MTGTSDTREQIQALLNNASEEARAVIAEVFKIEREKLYQSHPRGIPAEIVRAIEEIVT
jgi:hypothetical protein